jgi:hypothetical protein
MCQPAADCNRLKNQGKTEDAVRAWDHSVPVRPGWSMLDSRDAEAVPGGTEKSRFGKRLPHPRWTSAGNVMMGANRNQFRKPFPMRRGVPGQVCASPGSASAKARMEELTASRKNVSHAGAQGDWPAKREQHGRALDVLPRDGASRGVQGNGHCRDAETDSKKGHRGTGRPFLLLPT